MKNLKSASAAEWAGRAQCRINHDDEVSSVLTWIGCDWKNGRRTLTDLFGSETFNLLIQRAAGAENWYVDIEQFCL